MAVRISREGYQFLDPVGIGGTGSGVPVRDDGVRQMPPVDRPFAGKEEMPSSEALRMMTIPSDSIAAIQPPVPQVLFPQEFGYDDTPVTIMEVLDIDRWSPQIRSWVAPTVRMPRRVDDANEINASARNIGQTSNPML